jgi:hypothetical protein
MLAADVAHGEAIDAQDDAEVEHGSASQAAWDANERCEAACHAVNRVERLARTPPATLVGVAAVPVCQRDRGRLVLRAGITSCGRLWPRRSRL